ncbi:MAG TPA: 16S rRNA (cytosine(1402)-N(4))-methyltransferase, partial [Treponemataceae bacterium]|nr:16S rRNA (cytosine(1402)-N(4))-methyltransferase [Treponemataceae bacterium]
TKTFQALRIAVNGELEKLPSLLESAFSVLEPAGKLGVITFHSLEDRIVKNYFRELGKNCTCTPEMPICKCGGKPRAQVLTRKAVGPTDAEIADNSPSRSAKLRVVQKIRYGEESVC